MPSPFIYQLFFPISSSVKMKYHSFIKIFCCLFQYVNRNIYLYGYGVTKWW